MERLSLSTQTVSFFPLVLRFFTHHLFKTTNGFSASVEGCYLRIAAENIRAESSGGIRRELGNKPVLRLSLLR